VQFIVGDVVGKFARVEDGVVVAIRVRAVDEELGVANYPLVPVAAPACHAAIGVRNGPRHAANIGASISAPKPLVVEVSTGPRLKAVR